MVSMELHIKNKSYHTKGEIVPPTTETKAYFILFYYVLVTVFLQSVDQLVD